MAAKDTIVTIAEELGKAFTPIKDALDSPDSFSGFMHTLGWDLITIPQPLQDLLAPVEAVADIIQSGNLDVSNVASLIDKISKLKNAIDDLKNKPSNLFPTTIDFNEFKNEFPGQLVQHLIVEYLLHNQEKLASFLKLLGFIRIRFVEATATRPSYTKKEIPWSEIGAVLNDPLAAAKVIYKWGDPDFDANLFIENVVDVAGAIGLDVQLEKLNKNMFRHLTKNGDPVVDINTWSVKHVLFQDVVAGVETEAGAGLFILPETPTDKPGFSILPYAKGTSSQSFPLSENVNLKFEAAFDLTAGVGIVVRPDKPIDLITDIIPSVDSNVAPISKGSMSLGIENKKADGTKIILLGSDEGSRIQFNSLSLMSGAAADSAGNKKIFAEVRLQQAQIVIKAGEDADGFLNKLLPPDGFVIDFGLTVGLDSQRGIYFAGSGGIEIMLPVHIQLGPIEIQNVVIAVKIDNAEIPVELSTTVKGVLGPVTALIENIGLQARLTFPPSGGNLGPMNLSLGFKPPNGIGLAIDAGAVKGGGYLFFDFDKEEYAGALELTIVNFISAKAIGLITTRMPDGSKGFSMLVIITAEFFPPFQLGYGFTLNAVGGLIGLNRTVLLDPLRNGVRTGAVNSIMFPQNVIANAPRIISDLKTIFPPYEGRFLIGPMGKLGWGTPSLITLSLGLIIEIPGNIAILGVLRIALPEESIALINIQVNFVGTLDFEKKMLTFDASLYDSRILFMTLEGDMAVRLKWGDEPDFILTVGGFHPSYKPPPLALPALKRLAISILNTDLARIRVDCYQAVTSNTVQFGAKAEAFFGFSSLSVEGYVSFDALFQFSPFTFIIEYSSSFSLKAFGIGVYSVRLRGSLQGPTPWRVKGSGGISFFFFSIDVDFDKTWGESKDTSLPSIEILPRLLDELKKREQWHAYTPSGNQLQVSLRKLNETTDLLVLHPAGSLAVQQKIMPLDLDIDKVGNQKTSDIKRVAISKATSTGNDLTVIPLNDSFARAQYQDLSDADKLSKPSFEKLHGGVTITMGSNEANTSKMVRKIVEYEEIIIDKEPQKPLPKGRFLKQVGGLFLHFLRGSSVTKSSYSKAAKDKLQPFAGKIKVQEEGYAVAFTENNKVFHADAVFDSEAMAADYMKHQAAADPSVIEKIHVISAHELN